MSGHDNKENKEENKEESKKCGEWCYIMNLLVSRTPMRGLMRLLAYGKSDYHYFEGSWTIHLLKEYEEIKDEIHPDTWNEIVEEFSRDEIVLNNLSETLREMDRHTALLEMERSNHEEKNRQ
jgi:hypothetical protein